LSTAPAEETPFQKQIRELEGVLGPLSPQDKRVKAGVEPKPSSAQESIKTVNGVPVGIERGGKILTPKSQGWTAQDDVTWKQALTAYTQGDVDKTKRIQLAAQSRAWAWLQMPLAVFDVDTNSFTWASKADIDKDPEKYGPPGPAEKIVNQRRLFNEIDKTVKLVDGDIARLSNGAFDNDARVQIAMVLRDEKPKEAWYNFLNSVFAKSLDEAQMNYAIDLVSLQESALALRTLGGLGQGSDMMRAAIQKMLPGPGTPSRPYAQKQMETFGVEVNALKDFIPNIGAPGRGMMNQQAGPKKGDKKTYQGSEYTFDGKQWVR